MLMQDVMSDGERVFVFMWYSFYTGDHVSYWSRLKTTI